MKPTRPKTKKRTKAGRTASLRCDGLLGPYGCRCRTMRERVTGDGCDICNPTLAEEIKAENEAECCYCGIAGHDGDNCPTTFTPINDCEHKDADDGCCHHPKNMTPECHVGACPRLHRRIYDAWNSSLPNKSI